MKARRALTVLALTASFLPALAACGPNTANNAANNATPSTTPGGQARTTGAINLTWSTWGNPGELTRFYQLTDHYNKMHKNVHWTLIPIPNSGYLQKLQTELAGGKASDVFYMGDGDVSTIVKDNVLLNMTPYLPTGNPKHSISDWPTGVWGGAKVGNNVFGIAPDCNPLVIYFNKSVLKQAGITEDPIKLYEQGKWTWTKFQQICLRIKAKGKYGFIQDNWWAPNWTWAFTNGGKLYDSKGNFMGNTDRKSLAAFHYVANNLKSGAFTYSGSLPKGQGDDAMFMSNQVAFVTAGRWYAPEFNTAKGLNYDVVPYPTPSGKMMPTGIALAYVGINKRTAHPKESYDFLNYFVSSPGVIFRLQNGGNAIPALAKGPDWVATQGRPAHQKYIVQERQIGYPVPKEETSHPGLSTTITNDLDLAYLGRQSIDAALAKIAADVKKANAAG